MEIIIINRKEAGRVCAENARAAGLISPADVERAAERFSKLELDDLLTTVIETHFLRENAESGPRIPTPEGKISAN